MNNISEFQKHVEWKKLDTKQYVLYHATYMKFKNRQNKSMVVEKWLLVGWEGIDWRGAWGIFCILIVVWVIQLYTYDLYI